MPFYQRRRGTNVRSSKRIIFLCIFTTAIVLLYYRALLDKDVINDMEIFELARRPSSYPAHLDPINPLIELKTSGFENIDTTHVNGLIHAGTWIHVVDSSLKGDDPKLLLVKRGENLVTCPGTWSLIGEHAFRNEKPLNTARRGIKEEVGQRALDYVDKYGSIRNMTDIPVYYERDYGVSNGGRVDRQITYLWLVEMNLGKIKTGGKAEELDVLLDLDDEVADHKWISLSEFEDWVSRDKKSSSKAFCHDTIISLISLGIDRLKAMRQVK